MGLDSHMLSDNFLEACTSDDGSVSGLYNEVPIHILKKFAELVMKGNNEFQDVRNFNVKFDQLCQINPVLLTKRKMVERINFLQEELNEIIQGAGFDKGYCDEMGTYYEDGLTNNGRPQDMSEIADGLIDLCYVAKGTAVMMGLPWQQLWDEVQRANMAKERGVGKRGHLVDCIKPEGWEPPDINGVLADAGYDGSMREIDDPEHIGYPENREGTLII